MNSSGGDNAQSGMRLESMITSQNIINEIISGIRNKKINISSKTILPDNFVLFQNYPNPFNPITKINYELRIINYEFVSLKIFDALGREVATLVNQKQNAGRYEVEFDGRNLSSGVYFYKLETAEFTDIKRMVLIK